MGINTLKVFSEREKDFADDLLSAKVATMLGRKMEEGDWHFVYCNAKGIPITDWSNLHIDINHQGLGVEHKMLRISASGNILEVCGNSRMHPAGTRSIRINDSGDPEDEMVSVLNQYSELIEQRTALVAENAPGIKPDMRIGWLLWKQGLDEFLYFEEPMTKPNPQEYHAVWNETPSRGSRKSSKSLWVYERDSGKKKFSVTTTAGAKIQPYFDVPPAHDKNLYHFVVQGVHAGGGLIKVWLTSSTAKYLELLLGGLDSDKLSNAILEFDPSAEDKEIVSKSVIESIAIPVHIKEEAYKRLMELYDPISDEYMLQQFAIDFGIKS